MAIAQQTLKSMDHEPSNHPRRCVKSRVARLNDRIYITFESLGSNIFLGPVSLRHREETILTILKDSKLHLVVIKIQAQRNTTLSVLSSANRKNKLQHVGLKVNYKSNMRLQFVDDKDGHRIYVWFSRLQVALKLLRERDRMDIKNRPDSCWYLLRSSEQAFSWTFEAK